MITFPVFSARGLIVVMTLCFASAVSAFPAASVPSATSQQVADAACQAELDKFEKNIVYLRQTSGDQAASTVQEKLLPAKTSDELLAKEGPCGVTRFLRAKNKKIL